MNWIEDQLIGRRIFVALMFMGMFVVFGVAAMACGLVEPKVISNVLLILTGAVGSIVLFYFGNHTDQPAKERDLPTQEAIDAMLAYGRRPGE